MSASVTFDISNPYVVAGLIFGGMIPYLFGGIAMTAVGRAAGSVVEEVRRQFKEKPGIMAGHGAARLWSRGRHADQGGDQGDDRPLAAAGARADRRLFWRAADLGLEGVAFAALGASLLGVIVNGLFVAISMTSGGGAWDNAKKSFEDGFTDKDGVKHFKGGEAHKASVTGDTVGDPYKDTAGPAVNPGDQDHQHRRALALGDSRALIGAELSAQRRKAKDRITKSCRSLAAGRFRRVRGKQGHSACSSLLMPAKRENRFRRASSDCTNPWYFISLSGFVLTEREGQNRETIFPVEAINRSDQRREREAENRLHGVRRESVIVKIF